MAGGDDARLLIVFAAHSYDGEALLAGIRSETGETLLIGCSTAGEIASSGPGEAGVVVTVLGGPGFDVATRADVSNDLRIGFPRSPSSPCSASAAMPMRQDFDFNRAGESGR